MKRNVQHRLYRYFYSLFPNESIVCINMLYCNIQESFILVLCDSLAGHYITVLVTHYQNVVTYCHMYLRTLPVVFSNTRISLIYKSTSPLYVLYPTSRYMFVVSQFGINIIGRYNHVSALDVTLSLLQILFL